MIFNDTIVVSDGQFPTVLEAASKTTALDVIPAVLVQPHIQSRLVGMITTTTWSANECR
jgi:hypothetical protein